jgi:hypothetical protein
MLRGEGGACGGAASGPSPPAAQQTRAARRGCSNAMRRAGKAMQQRLAARQLARVACSAAGRASTQPGRGSAPQGSIMARGAYERVEV